MTNQPNPAEAGATPEGGKFTPEQTQAYIKQLREEAKANREAAEAATKALQTIQAQQEEQEREWLREQGDFKALAERQGTELNQAKAELATNSAYKAAFQAALDARIKAIPESMRSLVPEGMDPIALSTWLDKNAPLLSARSAPNLDPGAQSNIGGNPAIEVDPVELETARKFGYTPEQYRKIKGKFAPPT